MASRGSSISGSVTVSQRMSSLPCQTSARMQGSVGSHVGGTSRKRRRVIVEPARAAVVPRSDIISQFFRHTFARANRYLTQVNDGLPFTSALLPRPRVLEPQ